MLRGTQESGVTNLLISGVRLKWSNAEIEGKIALELETLEILQEGTTVKEQEAN